MRVSPVLELAKQRVQEGLIGQIQEMRGRGKEDARPIGLDAMVLGTHIMDLMRQFAGDPVWGFGRVTQSGRDILRTDVTGAPEGLGPIAGDSFSGMFAFADGISGYFGSKKNDDPTGVRYGMDLYGSKGVMTIRAGMEPQVSVMSSTRWTDAPWQKLTLPGNPPPRSQDDANAALVSDLFEAIEKDRPPKSSGEHARWALEMVMSVYESQRSGQRVALPLKRRDHPLTR
jgi:predicted dehydrogenase